MLVLTANNLAELGDLEPLGKFKRLTHLSLLENPVTRKEVSCWSWWQPGGRGVSSDHIVQHYRHWVIWKCPSVRIFDFQRVRDAERKRAKELFGTEKEPTSLASKVRGFRD